MRVYHYVGADHGLQNIQNRRLKVSMLDALNDPFDLAAFSPRRPDQRQQPSKLRQILGKSNSLLCFSSRTDNPVQWTHYAERHKGLCLGFDVPDALLRAMRYTRNRIIIEDLNALKPDFPQSIESMKENLYTKFSHWSYEREWRRFVRLDDCEFHDGNYFYRFCDDLILKEVLVGAASSISRSQLNSALGGLVPHVEAHKMRSAFRSFRVVKQRDKSLWL